MGSFVERNTPHRLVLCGYYEASSGALVVCVAVIIAVEKDICSQGV